MRAQQSTEPPSPADVELTTQEAADRLDISRQSLIRLLGHGEGQIPFRRAGSRRRIKLGDLEAHCRKAETQRQEAMQELADQAQELGLGY